MVVEILGVMKEVPVPKLVPPVGPAYQLIVPEEAVAPRVAVPEPQTLPGVVPVIEGIGFTVAMTAILDPVVQPFAVASTKYGVVVDILGVVNVFPDPRIDPPVGEEYQFIVPDDAVAPKVTVPVPHLLLGVVVVIVGIIFTVAITGVLVVEVHPFSVAST